MSRVLLITNPVAARHDPQVVQEITAALESLGFDVDVAGTTRDGDARRLAAEGVADRADVIAVHGGDGTVMQAMTGMMGADIPLALIPGGTGNLLAGNLGLPRDPVKAVWLVAHGVRRPIDLGSIERPEGTRHFAVASGAGFDAEIMAGTTGAAKRRWGMGAYLLEGWNRRKYVVSVPHRLTIDGHVLEVEAATVLVANCGAVYPLHFRLGQEIALDDGWLDVVVLRATGFAGGVAAMWELLRGSSNGGGRVMRARGKTITVESESTRKVQMDGELAGVTPFTAEIKSGAIDVLVPAESGGPRVGGARRAAIRR